MRKLPDQTFRYVDIPIRKPHGVLAVIPLGRFETVRWGGDSRREVIELPMSLESFRWPASGYDIVLLPIFQIPHSHTRHPIRPLKPGLSLIVYIK